MRRFALPIAISLLASYGCAASEESDPAGGGNTTSAGGAASVAGTGTGGTGTLTVGGSGGMITSGGTGTATAGSGTATAGTATASAGATGNAGTNGTGGGASVGGKCTTSAASTGTPPLIDDFDDGNADIVAVDGRMGGWYLSTDGTGTGMPAAGAILPIEGGKTGKGLHLTGAGFKTWGVSLGAAVANNLTGCYDASKFTGVTVDLKGTGSVFVTVLTAAVRDAPEGQRNHYKKQVTLTAEWTTTTVAFGEMTQPGGWGLIVPFDAKKIYGIDISPVQATAPATTDYDYWVDNLSFK